jgi:PST family polysaccharide transporter
VRSFGQRLFKGERRKPADSVDGATPDPAASNAGQPARPRVVGTAALWSVGNAFTAQAISLLAFLVTARFISPEAFGLVAVATLLVELTKRILVEPLAIRLMAMNNPGEQDYDDCFSYTVVLGFVGTLFVLALAKPLALLSGQPELDVILYVMAGMLVTMGLARTHEVWYAKRYEFRLLAIRSSAAAIVAGATGVTMALTGFGVWSLVAQQVVTSVASFILLFLFSRWRPHFRLAVGGSLRNLIGVKHYVFTNVVGFAGTQTDVFFVTSSLGAAAGGLYSAAKRLILAANLIVINSVQGVILTSFAERNQSPRAYQIHLDSLEIFALIITPLFVGLAILSEDVIAVLLSAAWLPSSAILAALSYAALGGGIALVVVNYLMAAGADRSRTAVIVGTAVITVAALPFVAPLGATVVAWFMAAMAWLSLFILAWVAAARSRVSFLQPLQALLLPIAGGAAMLGADTLIDLDASALLQLLIMPPVLFATYLAVVGMLGFATEARAVVHLRNALARRRAAR